MQNELLQVKVKRREVRGENVVVLELVADSGDLPAFTAGSHIDLHLADGIVRQYSLCGDPRDCSTYRLGVLRDPASRGGSEAVFCNLTEGQLISVSQPRNLFPLVADAAHSVLIGAGIGITPMLSMAWSLYRAGCSFELIYCGRSRAQSAFAEELADIPFADRVHMHFSAEHDGRRLNFAEVLPAAAGTQLYVCGPAAFMDDVYTAAELSGYLPEQLHREHFAAPQEESGGEAFEVEARSSGITLTVAPDQTILDALVEAGIEVEKSCEQGVCGTCLCDVLEGEPEHRDVYLTDDEKADNDQIILCCSRSRSARLVLDI